jgi:hypothetical protein
MVSQITDSVSENAEGLVDNINDGYSNTKDYFADPDEKEDRKLKYKINQDK